MEYGINYKNCFQKENFVYLQITYIWAIRPSPATLGRLSFFFIVVARHCTIYPLCQQVRSQMFWLKVKLNQFYQVNSLLHYFSHNTWHGTYPLQGMYPLPLYFILLFIIWSKGRKVEMFGSGFSSITVTWKIDYPNSFWIMK